MELRWSSPRIILKKEIPMIEYKKVKTNVISGNIYLTLHIQRFDTHFMIIGVLCLRFRLGKQLLNPNLSSCVTLAIQTPFSYMDQMLTDS